MPVANYKLHVPSWPRVAGLAFIFLEMSALRGLFRASALDASDSEEEPKVPCCSAPAAPVALAAAPFLFLSSMHVFVRDGLYSDAWRVKFVIEVARAMSPQLILPVIAFWGILGFCDLSIV